MLLTALPPAPPTPNTIMRAFISRISVMLVIFASRFLRQAENERTSIATQRPWEPRDLRLQCHDLSRQGDVTCLTRWPWRMPYFREIHAHQCFAIIQK
jgi:hypothetical protein